jgi:drug/metabolite transporter (DMT)-like permease
MLNWFLFGLLGLIWGSSFLLIKIAVDDFGPLPLVTVRLGLAAAAFVVVLLTVRRPLPRDRKTWLSLALLGLTNTTLPFLLITWGEQSIDSGLAGVLNAAVPLFSMVMAHFALQDDKMHFGKVFGLIMGFIGVVILALRTADPTHQNSVAGQVAVLLAGVSYAFSAVYLRRNLWHVESVVTAGTTLAFGAVYTLVAMLLLVNPLPTLAAIPSDAILAAVALGLLNTFIAYILFFRIIRAWGASRSTTVTYLMPPVSLTLGILFYGEVFDIRLVVAAVLIIGGVLMANLWKPAVRQAATASAAPTPAK